MKAAAALALLPLALLASGCNKGPAEDALRVAEESIAAARPELEKYAPGELGALTASVRQARAQVDEGRYTDALKAAQQVPAQVRAALAAAAAEKERRTESWRDLAQAVPRLTQAIATRIAWLNEARRLPRGLDEAGFAAARTELESVTRAWTRASEAFQGGDVEGAIRAGQEVEASAEALATRLGLVVSPPPPPSAPTPSPAPAAPAP